MYIITKYHNNLTIYQRVMALENSRWQREFFSQHLPKPSNILSNMDTVVATTQWGGDVLKCGVVFCQCQRLNADD